VSSQGLPLLRVFAAIAEIAQASHRCHLGLAFCSAFAGPYSHREGQNDPETPTSAATNLAPAGRWDTAPLSRFSGLIRYRNYSANVWQGASSPYGVHSLVEPFHRCLQ
jgi:hypothetical protein